MICKHGDIINNHHACGGFLNANVSETSHELSEFVLVMFWTNYCPTSAFIIFRFGR
jgi:hypothetical protein